MKHGQIIIFYGPPGSGKGTQANLLSKRTKIPFLDAGETFRNFAKIHEQNPNDERALRSKRMDECLKSGNPILTEDYMYIIGEKVKETVKSGSHLIMDKPGGSLIPEAEWMDGLIKENKFPVIFIHLPLSIEESIKRVEHRWYVPKSGEVFASKEEALNFLNEQKMKGEPYQREDDMKEEAIRNRYNKLYASNKERVLDIFKNNENVVFYELAAKSDLHEIENEVKLIVNKHLE